MLLKIGAADKIFGKICLKAIRDDRGFNFLVGGDKKERRGNGGGGGGGGGAVIQQNGGFFKILGMKGTPAPPLVGNSAHCGNLNSVALRSLHHTKTTLLSFIRTLFHLYNEVHTCYQG